MENKIHNENDGFEKEAIKYLNEDDLSKKYAKILTEQYHINRQPIPIKTRSISIYMKAAVWGILLIELTVVVMNMGENKELKSYARNYIKDTQILGNQEISRKDVVMVDSVRSLANGAFVNENYNEAIIQYEKIVQSEDVESIDQFYLALAYLKTDNVNASRAIVLLESIKDHETFLLEILWFKALGYLILEDNLKAKQTLETLKSRGQYKSIEVNDLLNKLELE